LALAFCGKKWGHLSNFQEKAACFLCPAGGQSLLVQLNPTNNIAISKKISTFVAVIKSTLLLKRLFRLLPESIAAQVLEWYTSTLEVRMPQGLGVRVSSWVQMVVIGTYRRVLMVITE
jgi:hypothetical protein